jgi:hypothetical protein
MANMRVNLAVVRDVMGITPDKIASIAGLVEDGNPELTLETRLDAIKQILGPVQSLSRPEQEVFLGELAAKYLPAMKAKFDEIDVIITPAVMVMNISSAFPYFVRFAKLPQNASITPTHAHRLAHAPAAFARPANEDDVATACQFLSTLLAIQGADGVPDADKGALVGKLRQWKRTFAGRFAEETITRCLDYLSGNMEMVAMTMMLGMMIAAPLEKCNFPGCKKKRQGNEGGYVSCEKCKTAAYCSPLHKSRDQAAHNPKCFEVTY